MDWSGFDKGIFLVNVLGIVKDPKDGHFLIGRRENDPYIENLTWCFPGGRPGYNDDLETYLKEEIKKKTGLTVKVNDILFARMFPGKKEIILIYYMCEVVGGDEVAGDKFVEIKWVKPEELEEYFTTSLDIRLLTKLKTIEL